MLNKNFFRIIPLTAIIVSIFISCSNNTANKQNTPESTVSPKTQGETILKSFTIDELKQYNGQNGNAAYVAIDGNVYDVTNNELWRNGKHGGYNAGKDLTAEIKKSPHGSSVLKDLPVVGKIVP